MSSKIYSDLKVYVKPKHFLLWIDWWWLKPMSSCYSRLSQLGRFAVSICPGDQRWVIFKILNFHRISPPKTYRIVILFTNTFFLIVYNWILHNDLKCKTKYLNHDLLTLKSCSYSECQNHLIKVKLVSIEFKVIDT